MTVDRAVELPLLKAVVEVGRQGHARLHTAALQHLDDDRADRRPGSAKADDVELQALALGIGPEPLPVFFEALALE